MSITMTIRLEEGVRDRLEQLADATHRSRSFLAAEAIREYVEVNEWQINEIHAALAEADGEDFAGADEVKALREKWNADAG